MLEEPPPQRADARRNRARILEAAAAVLAHEGLEAQMDVVAREAGVGVGTLYRHFPDKEALVEAVMLEQLGALRRRAEEALAETEAGALERFMGWAAECMATDRCLVASGAAPTDRVLRAQEGFGPLVAQLLERAQEAGEVRADLVPEDLAMLVFGIGGAQAGHPSTPRTTWQRHLAIVLDGIRATGTPPLPPLPDGWPDRGGPSA